LSPNQEGFATGDWGRFGATTPVCTGASQCAAWTHTDLDCEDGSVDLGRGTVFCGFGERVEGDARCAGYADCDDGLDETGCPQFACKWGELVGLSGRCEGLHAVGRIGMRQ
jgi:hypothetical protein